MAKPLKLLLVEDNPGDRCLLEALLYETHPGCFELLCAGSLAEGLELARSPGLAIVLLDLGLPDSQGTDTLRRMRAGAPGLPIVVFTGHDDDRLAADALREGAQDYLVKGTGDGALIARSIRYSIERKRGDDMLHRAYDELELRVRERTADLARANELLQREIAERKQAEERLVSSLREKEVLLREIHHRVKNNLQIVASMLNMQMSSIKEEADRVPFLESQSRVRAIALIHEKLYGSEDLARIPFDDYVADLVSSLRSSFREEACRVTFELDLKPVRLEVGTAIPVALILNELLSNVLKHAFPKPRQGRVRVSLLRREDNRCELAVADDGAGFPARLDLEHAGTMGLQIVSVLTRQLGASIELRRQGGTCVVLTFG